MELSSIFGSITGLSFSISVWVFWIARNNPDKLMSILGDKSHNLIAHDRSAWIKNLASAVTLISFAVFIGVVANSGLFWMSEEWRVLEDEDGDSIKLQTFLSVLAGIVGSLLTYDFVRHYCKNSAWCTDLEESAEVYMWLENQLVRDYSPSESLIDFLDQEASSNSQSNTKRRIARKKLTLAKAWEERDQRLFQKWQDAEQRAEVEAEEKDRKRKRLEAEAAKARINEQKLAIFMPNNLPLALDIEALPYETEAVLDHTVSCAAWALFKDRIRPSRPKSEDDVDAAAQRLIRVLSTLPGIEIPSGFSISITYVGDAHGSVYDIVCLPSDLATSFPETLEYVHSTESILLAFFLSVFTILEETSWASWHGLYDRDYRLLLTEGQSKAALVDVTLPDAIEKPWPPVGIRVRRSPKTVELSCLATNRNCDLFDLSLLVDDGRADRLQIQKLFTSGIRVFY